MVDGISSLTASHSVAGPDRIEYGLGATQTLASFAEVHDATDALVVTDAGLDEAGVVDGPVSALEAAGVTVEVFDGVEPEPKLRMIAAAADALRTGGHDLVVGVGGGSPMDVAKVAAVLADADVAVRDLLGTDNVPRAGRPLALLPTTAGTGSEVTNVGVFTDTEDGHAKKVAYSRHLFADLAVVDPELTETLPPAVAAATGMDALTHAVEAYVSTRRNPYADMLAGRAIELVGENLRQAVHQGPENDRARYNMSLAATLAGQAFINAGLGAVHALTYPLGVELGLGHGLANAVLLPAVVEYNHPTEPERFADVARWLGCERRAAESTRAFAARSVGAIADLNADIGIPPTIAAFDDSLGIGDFERFADIAFEHSKHNIDRNPRVLDRDDVVHLFETAYEGVR